MSLQLSLSIIIIYFWVCGWLCGRHWDKILSWARALNKWIWILLAAVIAFLLLNSCATFNLEKRLPKDIWNWYEQHLPIMEYAVPKTVDPKTPREFEYFLSLPEQLQRKYIKLFWDIREVGAKEEYALRMSVVTYWFRHDGINPWQTDLGRVLLQVGQPFNEDFVNQYGDPYLEGTEEWSAQDPARPDNQLFFRVWSYWHGSGFFQQVIKLWFIYSVNKTWEYIEPVDKVDQDFIEYCRWRMAPTPEGWELWLSQISK